MSSQYSPRLYEILKSYQKNNREWYFELDDLKRLLDCQSYERWPDFRRRALEPAVEEINQYTDINIAWDVEKEGKKVTRVIFYMAKKNADALLDAKRAIQDKLDGQLTIEDILAQLPDEADSVKARFYRENPVKSKQRPSEGEFDE
jgi:plasmid replication initiation protein